MKKWTKLYEEFRAKQVLEKKLKDLEATMLFQFMIQD
jgi:hypothetical protein